METIQNALKDLYITLGGDAESVRNTEDVNAIIDAISALDLGDQLAGAAVKELPVLPKSDGTYALQLVMDDGVATLTWEAAE